MKKIKHKIEKLAISRPAFSRGRNSAAVLLCLAGCLLFIVPSYANDWGEWSEWQDTEVKETETCDVETRQVVASYNTGVYVCGNSSGTRCYLAYMQGGYTQRAHWTNTCTVEEFKNSRVLPQGSWYDFAPNVAGYIIGPGTAYVDWWSDMVPHFITETNYKIQYRYRILLKSLVEKTTLQVKSGKNKAVLTWTSVPYATKYIVYHSVKKGSKWKSLGSKNVKKKLRITNTNLKKKSIHKYRIKAILKIQGKTFNSYSKWESVKIK